MGGIIRTQIHGFLAVVKKRCFCSFVVFVGIRRDEEEKGKTNGWNPKNESLEYLAPFQMSDFQVLC